VSVVDCPVLVADFGTSTSSGAVIGADGAIRMLKEPGSGSWSWPSAVAVHGEQLVVGTAAERRKKAAPQAYRAEFKRDLGQDLPIPLGDRSFAVTELIAAVLRVFGRQAAALIGRNVQRVVLTVPASYGPDDPRRELMITAGEAAGFSEVELLSEPVAAAYAPVAGVRITPDSVLLVYDFGGGTFDAALIRLSESGSHTVLGFRALDDCGGRDIDAVLADNLMVAGGQEMAEVLNPVGSASSAASTMRMRLVVGEFVRSVKHQLSDVDEVEDYVTPSAPPYELDRGELAELIRPQLKRTIGCCRDLLSDCRVELSDLGGVLLVGGTSRMPLVADLVAAELSESLLRPEDPDLAVVIGAAQWAKDRGVPAAVPRYPAPDRTPLTWEFPGGGATLLRCDVEPGSDYSAGSRLGLVRLGDDTLLELTAPADPGALLIWHARPGDRVVDGDWIVTVRPEPSLPDRITGAAARVTGPSQLSADERERSGPATTSEAIYEATLRRILRHDNPVASVAVSSQRGLVASACDQGIVRLWTIEDGSMRQLTDKCRSLAMDRAGERLVTGGAAGVQLWSTGSNRVIRAFSVDKATSVDISADGRLIVAVFEDHARIWSVYDGVVLRDLPTRDGASGRMAKFRPDAAQVLLIDRSGWTSVWSLNPFSSVFESNDLVPNVGAAYSSDNRLLATVQEDGRVTICDAQAPADGPLQSYAGTTTTQVAALALGVASSPMAVGGAQNNRNLVRMLATDVRKSLGIMSFRPPRQTDIANESARDAAAARITGLAYSADGRLLVAGSSDGTARLWEFPS